MASMRIEKRVSQAIVTLRQGDLTALDVDAVVYYAREDLQLGAGYGTAIQSRGGVAVKRELEQAGRLGMGDAVITTAGNMNAQYIIHACGPKFHEVETENKLRSCMESALRLADLKRLKTVAFPPMGAGFYGIPLAVCARVMLDTIKTFLLRDTSLEEIVLCTIDLREFSAFRSAVEAM